MLDDTGSTYLSLNWPNDFLALGLTSNDRLPLEQVSVETAIGMAERSKCKLQRWQWEFYGPMETLAVHLKFGRSNSTVRHVFEIKSLYGNSSRWYWPALYCFKKKEPWQLYQQFNQARIKNKYSQARKPCFLLLY